MISLEEIKKVVDNSFWKRALKLQPNKVKSSRIETLGELCSLINNGQYSPDSPVIVMEFDKGHGVVRHVPVFNMIDYCVYYYCVKKLDPVLAKKRIPNTYGGWSLDGGIKELEQKEEEKIYGLDYELTFSYAPKAWAKYYGEFNSKLYRQLLKYKQKEGFIVVEFDLANYYDNIRLDILERQIRADSDFRETEVLNLLFYFLSYRDRKLSSYNPQYVGLPQDAIGDCSRLLANYYIQNYDHFMHSLLEKYDGSYFRFADDQFIFCKKIDKNRLMQSASRKLLSIGLNINQLKVKVWNLEGLEEYRSFALFDILAVVKKEELKSKINSFAEKVFAISKPEELKNRGYPLLRRLLSFNFNFLRPDLRAQLLGRVVNKDFIYSSKAHYLTNIYKNLRKEEKADFLILLEECLDESMHNAFHFELIKFTEGNSLEDLRAKSMKRILKLNQERQEVAQ